MRQGFKSSCYTYIEGLRRSAEQGLGRRRWPGSRFGSSSVWGGLAGLGGTHWPVSWVQLFHPFVLQVRVSRPASPWCLPPRPPSLLLPRATGLSRLWVFRNQLPKKKFYPSEPPSENPPPQAGESWCLQLRSGAPLCRACGYRAPEAAPEVTRHITAVGGIQVQTGDWDTSRLYTDHQDSWVPDRHFLFPGFETVMETEAGITPEVVEKDGVTQITGSVGEAPEKELDSIVKHESGVDNILQKFKPKIAFESRQILRDWQRDCPHLDSWWKYPSTKGHSRLPLSCQETSWIPGRVSAARLPRGRHTGNTCWWGHRAGLPGAQSYRLGIGYTEQFVWSKM